MAGRGTSPGAAAEEDVVALLMRRHEGIRERFDAVEAAAGDDGRRAAFRRLVRLVTAHETAEEEVVHPYARGAVEGGEEIVAARLEEERRTGEALLRLESMDCAGPGRAAFVREFAALREVAEAHARAEERYEFPPLEAGSDPEWRRAMARAVRAAESAAPTRPYPAAVPGGEDAGAGPFAAVVDRARDARHGEGL
ncbi:hemerythrin domain-containing protein [Streptomyces radiopugnans]|uniref:Hemerythrin HHE cation binding domain-containing protein n=1 Tax=Streptomyces radiopugnans TaxID=403935 RepID=A0A1H9AZY1_9ACTN|nr:hemerythrin domain-containing protein [Streptomyces radiopugnans]SEP82021.1 Hemerythrin HHE cation binding domain-containing protein [Streptomyces radiopugnans]